MLRTKDKVSSEGTDAKVLEVGGNQTMKGAVGWNTFQSLGGLPRTASLVASQRLQTASLNSWPGALSTKMHC